MGAIGRDDAKQGAPSAEGATSLVLMICVGSAVSSLLRLRATRLDLSNRYMKCPSFFSLLFDCWPRWSGRGTRKGDAVQRQDGTKGRERSLGSPAASHAVTIRSPMDDHHNAHTIEETHRERNNQPSPHGQGSDDMGARSTT